MRNCQIYSSSCMLKYYRKTLLKTCCQQMPNSFVCLCFQAKCYYSSIAWLWSINLVGLVIRSHCRARDPVFSSDQIFKFAFLICWYWFSILSIQKHYLFWNSVTFFVMLFYLVYCSLWPRCSHSIFKMWQVASINTGKYSLKHHNGNSSFFILLLMKTLRHRHSKSCSTLCTQPPVSGHG